MKICLLASGSKGNSTYLETKNHKILIDIGTPTLYVEKMLRELEILPEEIDSVFITHTHSDHVSGLKVFCKKYQPTIYLTEKMYVELKDQIGSSPYVLIDRFFQLDELTIQTFRTSHDTTDGLSYVLECEQKSIVYVTDTGYISEKYHPMLFGRDVYIMESNHDIELLMASSKPYHLKQRILGDKGHLSNKDTAYYLSQFIGENTQCIVLAHLSEENNTEELAREELLRALDFEQKATPQVLIARQKTRTDLIEV